MVVRSSIVRRVVSKVRSVFSKPSPPKTGGGSFGGGGSGGSYSTPAKSSAKSPPPSAPKTTTKTRSTQPQGTPSQPGRVGLPKSVTTGLSASRGRSSGGGGGSRRTTVTTAPVTRGTAMASTVAPAGVTAAQASAISRARAQAERIQAQTQRVRDAAMQAAAQRERARDTQRANQSALQAELNQQPRRTYTLDPEIQRRAMEAQNPFPIKGSNTPLRPDELATLNRTARELSQSPTRADIPTTENITLSKRPLTQNGESITIATFKNKYGETISTPITERAASAIQLRQQGKTPPSREIFSGGTFQGSGSGGSWETPASSIKSFDERVSERTARATAKYPRIPERIVQDVVTTSEQLRTFTKGVIEPALGTVGITRESIGRAAGAVQNIGMPQMAIPDIVREQSISKGFARTRERTSNVAQGFVGDFLDNPLKNVALFGAGVGVGRVAPTVTRGIAGVSTAISGAKTTAALGTAVKIAAPIAFGAAKTYELSQLSTDVAREREIGQTMAELTSFGVGVKAGTKPPTVDVVQTGRADRRIRGGRIYEETRDLATAKVGDKKFVIDSTGQGGARVKGGTYKSASVQRGTLRQVDDAGNILREEPLRAFETITQGRIGGQVTTGTGRYGIQRGTNVPELGLTQVRTTSPVTDVYTSVRLDAPGGVRITRVGVQNAGLVGEYTRGGFNYQVFKTAGKSVMGDFGSAIVVEPGGTVGVTRAAGNTIASVFSPQYQAKYYWGVLTGQGVPSTAATVAGVSGSGGLVQQQINAPLNLGVVQVNPFSRMVSAVTGAEQSAQLGASLKQGVSLGLVGLGVQSGLNVKPPQSLDGTFKIDTRMVTGTSAGTAAVQGLTGTIAEQKIDPVVDVAPDVRQRSSSGTAQVTQPIQVPVQIPAPVSSPPSAGFGAVVPPAVPFFPNFPTDPGGGGGSRTPSYRYDRSQRQRGGYSPSLFGIELGKQGFTLDFEPEFASPVGVRLPVGKKGGRKKKKLQSSGEFDVLALL